MIGEESEMFTATNFEIDFTLPRGYKFTGWEAIDQLAICVQFSLDKMAIKCFGGGVFSFTPLQGTIYNYVSICTNHHRQRYSYQRATQKVPSIPPPLYTTPARLSLSPTIDRTLLNALAAEYQAQVLHVRFMEM